MTWEDYLLVCIAEESAEVGQMAAKSLRFGRKNTREGQYLTNDERLIREFIDLAAVMELLIMEGMEDPGLDLDALLEEKKARVKRYWSAGPNQPTNDEFFIGDVCVLHMVWKCQVCGVRPG